MKGLQARFTVGWFANRHWLSVGLVGLTSLVLYVFFFLRPYPLLVHYAVPLLDLGKLTDRSVAAAREFAVVFLLLFALCYLAYLLCRRFSSRWGLLLVFLFALLCGLALVFVYPITAADVFEYIAYARIAVFHGTNPHLYMPADFAGDPFMLYPAWPHITSPYGPLWTHLSVPIGVLGGPSLLTYLLLFKSLALGVHLLNSGLIYAILMRWRPPYALAGTVLYAWNPLVLFESVANAHNDGLVIFFILLAVYLHLRGKFALALPVATCSFLVKLPTAVLVPLFFVAAWKTLGGRAARLRVLSVGVLLSVALVVLLYAPLWEGRATLGWLGRGDLFTSSPATVVVLVLRQ